MLKLSPHSMLHSQPRFRIATVAAVDDQIERLTTTLPPDAQLQHFERLEQLCEDSSADSNLVLIYQSHQDQYEPVAVAKLRNRFPLARILVVLNPLSASEGRSRTFWPVAWCVPDWKLESRLAAELAVLTGTRPSLAATADRDEMARFEFSRDSLREEVCAKEVVTYSADPIWNETLGHLLTEFAPDRIAVRGCSTLPDVVRQLEKTPRAALVFDVDPFEQSTRAWVDANRALIVDRRAIALSNWITGELETRLRTAGFDDVVCKLDPIAIQRTLCG